MKPYSYLNGKIVKTKDPHIAMDDIAVLRGFGVFDFLRIYNKTPFLLKEHYKRFQNSAKALGLKVPISYKNLELILDKLIKKNHVKNVHVRMVLTGGKMREGMLPGKPNFYILFEEYKDFPLSCFTKGIDLMLYEHQRLLPHAKTTNYLQAVTLQKLRKQKKAVEILYTYKEKILEGTTSNIFIIKKGKLITSKEGILKGLTRELVIKLAKKEKIKVIERDIKVKEIYDADEVFLTATNKRVMPVVRINGKKIKKGRPGDITLRLLDKYQEYVDVYTK